MEKPGWQDGTGHRFDRRGRPSRGGRRRRISGDAMAEAFRGSGVPARPPIRACFCLELPGSAEAAGRLIFFAKRAEPPR